MSTVKKGMDKNLDKTVLKNIKMMTNYHQRTQTKKLKENL